VGHKLNESVKPAKALRLDEPQSYIPEHLTQKILGGRTSLEGERKQVTVWFLQKRKPSLAIAISILLVVMILGGGRKLIRTSAPCLELSGLPAKGC
jgi:hypothetical protein